MTLAACSLSRRCWSCASVIACSSCTLGSARSLNVPVSLAVMYFQKRRASFSMGADGSRPHAARCRLLAASGRSLCKGEADDVGHGNGVGLVDLAVDQCALDVGIGGTAIEHYAHSGAGWWRAVAQLDAVAPRLH